MEEGTNVAERLEAAASFLERTLRWIEERQSVLAGEVEKISATVEATATNRREAELAERLEAAEKELAELKASAARATLQPLRKTVAAIPAAVHTLNETDGTLDLASLSLTANVKRALANDITVCGEKEPAAYVTEYFLGDGVTAQFYLAEEPYAPPGSRRELIRELFNESQIDARVWSNAGGAGYFSVGAGGLAILGGDGVDGDTLLTWIDPIEMGGTLLLEATGVQLTVGSGVLAGSSSAWVHNRGALPDLL